MSWIFVQAMMRTGVTRWQGCSCAPTPITGSASVCGACRWSCVGGAACSSLKVRAQREHAARDTLACMRISLGAVKLPEVCRIMREIQKLKTTTCCAQVAMTACRWGSQWLTHSGGCSTCRHSRPRPPCCNQSPWARWKRCWSRLHAYTVFSLRAETLSICGALG